MIGSSGKPRLVCIVNRPVISRQGMENNFSVWEAKIGEKQPRQSNSRYNFMQYVFFEKGICSAQWGLGHTFFSGWL